MRIVASKDLPKLISQALTAVDSHHRRLRDDLLGINADLYVLKVNEARAIITGDLQPASIQRKAPMLAAEAGRRSPISVAQDVLAKHGAVVARIAAHEAERQALQAAIRGAGDHTELLTVLGRSGIGHDL